MKTYHGYRRMIKGLNGKPTTQACEVMVRLSPEGAYPLRPRLDLRNHSPTGFEWGYGGSGPAQLALALAADVLGDEERALAVYQELKAALVRYLPPDGWTLREEMLREFLALLEGGESSGRSPG